jgi:hypothetical protein
MSGYMQTNTIEFELAAMLSQIQAIMHEMQSPTAAQLRPVATLLERFVVQHRDTLTLSNFPLPQVAGQVLCSYRLHGEDGEMLCLELQAINAGVRTPIHDHGTWAILVAVTGTETHQVYRLPTDVTLQEALTLEYEVDVCCGQSLVLEAGLFHRMSTDAPALQLHLYGQPLEYIPVRHIVDEQTGTIVPVHHDA